MRSWAVRSDPRSGAVPQEVRRRRTHGIEERERRLAARLLVPALGLLFVIVNYPFAVAVFQSIKTESGGLTLSHYNAVLGSNALYESCRVMLEYAAIVLPSETVLGLIAAWAAHHHIKSLSIKLLLYLLAMVPIVMPPVAVGVIGRLIFAPDYGVLNHLLGVDVQWFSHPGSAMFAVAVMDIWQWTPFVYLIVLAGFQTVSSEIVEAAKMDGASDWQIFRYIELEYLKPFLILAIFFRLADVFKVFDHLFIMTGGGPGSSTQVLSLYLYRLSFKYFNLSEGSALAMLIMVLISVIYGAILKFLPLHRKH
jgi:multiple sugar transport system permease protein